MPGRALFIGLVLVAIASAGVAACGGDNGDEFWDAPGDWEGRAVFTEEDVEGAGLSEAAADELEACGFETDESTRAELAASLGGGITAAPEVVVAGSGGSLEVRNTGTQIDLEESGIFPVYEVECLGG